MFFRRILLSAVCAAMLTGAAFAAEPAAAAEPVQLAETEESSNLSNMGRGLVNILTCFLEIPRCLVYRNCETPIFGLIAGAVNGTGCTVMRLMSGVTDILTLGFDYGSVFNETFRPFVWDSRWLPPKPEASQK